MTGFDDFDDDDTVVHATIRQPEGSAASVPASPPAAPTGLHEFDDDDTIVHAVPSNVLPSNHRLSGNEESAEPARSLEVLQHQAPFGAGWTPPDRPTSYEARPYDGPTSPGRLGRMAIAALVVGLAVIGCAATVGAWFLLTESADQTDPIPAAPTADDPTAEAGSEDPANEPESDGGGEP